MPDKSKFFWWLAFTAVFAVLAGFVFWGTWGVDVSPVMPDCWIAHPADHLRRFLTRWLAHGTFIPSDLMEFLGDPTLWQELQYALAVYCAALGVAYYCRGRGLSRLAGYGAGLLLAFCGYWLTLFSAGHLGWFRWMFYGVFAFALADRAVRRGKPRHWLLLGAVVAWASFNQQDLWLLFTLFTAAYFVWCCVRERKLPWRGALVSAAVFVAIAAPNVITTLSVTLKNRENQIARGENITSDDADEAARRWEFVTNWSMPPEDTLEFLVPGVHGDTSCPFVLSIGRRLGTGVTPYIGRLGRALNATSGNYRQHSLYVGWAICLFALCGLVAAFAGERRHRGEIAFFFFAAVVFYLLSLGRFFAPAYRLVFALPFGDLIRCPVKWHHLTEFCLAVLAAYGLGWLCTLKVARSRLGVAVLSALVVLGAVDLARVARRYCVPVNVRPARLHDMKEELTILRRSDFSAPQVAEMVRRGYIISLANYMGLPDMFVVAVLTPFEKEDSPASPMAIALGLLSLMTTLGVAAYGVKKS